MLEHLRLKAEKHHGKMASLYYFFILKCYILFNHVLFCFVINVSILYNVLTVTVLKDKTLNSIKKNFFRPIYFNRFLY